MGDAWFQILAYIVIASIMDFTCTLIFPLEIKVDY